MFLHDAGGSEVSRDCLVGSVLDFDLRYSKWRNERLQKLGTNIR